MKNIVTPSKVHKNDINDVLIYEPDIVLISSMTIPEYDVLIEDDPELFKSIYTFCPERNIYKLRTLPSIISKDDKNKILNWIDISNFYKILDDQNKLYLTSTYVPLHVEETLRKTFLPNISVINNLDKLKVSKLQKTAPVHSYFLFNDTKNEYFYKKKHEHVPGMMLVEAARQAVYDYVYTNSGHVLKEVSISMSNLNVNFQEYTISSYPVELLFSHREYELRRKPKNIDKKGWFYQRGKLTGTFSLEGGIIPMSIFPRLRNEKYNDDHNFYPFDETYIKLKNNAYEKIIYLSPKYLTVELTNHSDINISEVTLGEDYFPIEKCQHNKNNSKYHDLIFDRLSKSQILTLNNLINTSYFNRSRFKEMDI